MRIVLLGLAAVWLAAPGISITPEQYGEFVRAEVERWEFFVSQTPELTAMADAVIDLDRMATEAQAELEAPN